MIVTSIGLVLIPLSLIIFFARPTLLVPWAILVSVFQAASVINLGGDFPVGIAPFFFVVVLIALRFIPQYVSGRFGFPQEDPLLSLSRPLALLALWGAVSAFVLPFLFADVPVNIPRAGMDTVAYPLHWSLSNAAQAGYLILDFVFVMATVQFVRAGREMNAIVQAFRWAGIIGAIIGAYQFVALKFGLSYPREFFNSNEAWAQLLSEKIAGIGRVSSTFSEPSVAGGFFAAWTAFLLSEVSNSARARRWDWVLLSAGIAMLTLTTSSTGYIAEIFLLCLFGIRQVLRLFVQGTVNPRVLVIFAIIGVSILCAVVLVPDIDRLLREVLFQKAGSESGADRMATQWQSLTIVRETTGLGVGLGSNRPSGMLFYLISNLGLPGLLLFIYCIYLTFSLNRTFNRQSAGSVAVNSHSHGFAWAFAITLLAMFISGAEITTPQMWITWSFMIGSISLSSGTRNQKTTPMLSAQYLRFCPLP